MTDLTEPAGLELPVPNLPLLRKVLDHIDAHPEEHNQSLWGIEPQCGTAYCIAGHALVMSGHTLSPWRVDGPDGQRLYLGVMEAAETALGLTTPEAFNLFRASNSREQIQSIAESVAARGGERL